MQNFLVLTIVIRLNWVIVASTLRLLKEVAVHGATP